MNNCVIIGGGPAGLMAASQTKSPTYLIERNGEIGRKLLISGGGQCNFTNNAPMNIFVKNYGKASNWLKFCLYNFSNLDAIDFFQPVGVFIREDGKVFPASKDSQTIIDFFKQKLVNIKLLKSLYVYNIEKLADGSFSIFTDTGKINAKFVVLATGGKAYPLTGSDGFGYELAQKLGHSIITPQPALTSIIPEEYFFGSIAGVSIKNVFLIVGKKQFKGDLLFAHNWLTGPVIVDNSHLLRKGDQIFIKFCDLSLSDFDKKIDASLKKFLKRKKIPERLLLLLIPQKILKKKIAELSKKDIKLIITNTTHYEIKIKEVNGFEISMATSGGVSLKEVNAKTMESRICKNLFFAGEILDFVGISGGFNIQAAFSTGYLAGCEIHSRQSN